MTLEEVREKNRIHQSTDGEREQFRKYSIDMELVPIITTLEFNKPETYRI